VRSRPEANALVFEDETITWAFFGELVDQASSYLALHVPGDRIALSLPNSLDLAFAIFGSIRAGKAVQVLDTSWPDALMRSVLERLCSDFALTSSNVDAFSRHLSSGDRLAVRAIRQADPFAPFYTGFTSGSTGTPKGFRRDQNSWLESFRSEQKLFSLSAEDVFVALGSLAHSLFMYALMRGVYAGSTTLFFAQFRPDRILRRIEEIGGSVVYGVPTQYDALLSVAEGIGKTLSHVRLVLSSGAKLPDDLKERLHHVFPMAEVCEFYGTSEQSYVSVARDAQTPAGSVGHPFPDVRVTILDDNGSELPRGEIGRVFVESKLMFQGYELAENPTLERAGEALFVGDMGYLDKDGFLYLSGRSDRMIISSGKNIYPEEIETTLITHPDVMIACVMGIADVRRGARLVAVVKPSAASAVTSSALIAWCRDRLPLYKVPMIFYRLSDWPMTGSQKSDLPRLRDLLDGGDLERSL
jgi:long-chain acyl-CoA synthetase